MKKKIGLLLLDENDNYVYEDGSLPSRPKWDKAFLTTMLEGEIVSPKGYDMLPESMQKKVYIDGWQTPFPVTIPEIAMSDILFITRGYGKELEGKRFRLDDFEKLFASGKLEVWKRR
jgi:hypothetical protein